MPVAIEDKRAAVPMHPPDAVDPNDIDGIADRAQPCHRGFGQGQHRNFGERVGIDQGQSRRHAVGQVLGGDQAAGEDDKAVPRCLDRQLQPALDAAFAIEPVQPAAIDDIQIAIGVQRHPARPHRPATQAGRLDLCLQVDGVNFFHASGGRQTQLGPQRRVGQQVDLAGRAQDSHGREQRAAGGASQALTGLQGQRLG